MEKINIENYIKQGKILSYLISILLALFIGENLGGLNNLSSFIFIIFIFFLSKIFLDFYLFRVEDLDLFRIKAKLYIGWFIVLITLIAFISIEFFKTPKAVSDDKFINHLYQEKGKITVDKLYDAIIDGNIETVENYLRSGGNPNVLLKYGYPMILIASKYGQTEIVKLLLKYGADPDIRNDAVETALILATQNRHFDTVKVLLQGGANPNIPDLDGNAPLHYAVKNVYTEIVELLIYYGADPYLKNNYGLTPMDYAKNIKDKLRRNYILGLLILDTDKPMNKFMLAVKVDDLETVKKLMENYNINPNITIFNGLTPLHIASFRGYEDLVKFLIEKGADVNKKTKSGLFPLHYAALKGESKIIKILLNAGADINIKNKNGFTPLHFSINSRNLETVKLLIENGADINAQANNLKTPLHLAVFWGDYKITQYLLKKGANPNIQDIKGRTPLHYAVLWEEENIIKLLLKYGADPYIKDKDGFTAVDYASNSINPSILNIFFNKKDKNKVEN